MLGSTEELKELVHKGNYLRVGLAEEEVEVVDIT